jgi:hypothetical protein
MSPTADQLVSAYLKRLDAELADVPRARRREVVQEISQHIEEARAELTTQNEAEIRNVLDRLGDPAEIAAAARERSDVHVQKAGWQEIGALIMLLAGGLILPVIGWFVGVVLLWISDAWETRDKLIGTLLVPGGLVSPLGLGVVAAAPATGATLVLAITLLVALTLIPLATTAYLAWRLRQPSVPAAV